MKKFMRFTALVTLAAFLGLSAVETFHSHQANETAATCPVCQIAHQTPAILSATPVVHLHWLSTRAHISIPLQSYVQYVFVSHGLSPPIL